MKDEPMTDDLLQLFENAGVSLPNENSLGDKIVPDGDSEKLLNFWNWFGDSKMVDRRGRPLVVYHGTSKKFDEFDRSKSKDGFFFAPLSRRNTVSGYYAFYDSNTNGTIMPCYIRMENPLFVHRPYGKEDEKARADGSIATYDGIIAIYDDEKEMSLPQYDYVENKIVQEIQRKGEPIEYIVFNPKQIKSVENKGLFSQSTANIYESV